MSLLWSVTSTPLGHLAFFHGDLISIYLGLHFGIKNSDSQSHARFSLFSIFFLNLFIY